MLFHKKAYKQFQPALAGFLSRVPFKPFTQNVFGKGKHVDSFQHYYIMMYNNPPMVVAWTLSGDKLLLCESAWTMHCNEMCCSCMEFLIHCRWLKWFLQSLLFSVLWVKNVCSSCAAKRVFQLCGPTQNIFSCSHLCGTQMLLKMPFNGKHSNSKSCFFLPFPGTTGVFKT